MADFSDEAFFMESRTLGELAVHVGGRVVGSEDIVIRSAATLGRAEEGEISFLANDKYEKQVAQTKASAVIVGKEIGGAGVPLLIAEDPYYAFMQIMVLLHGHRRHKQTGVSPKASISDTAKIGKDCHIHDFATIDDGAKIGERCVIYPGVYIGQDTEIGSECIIYPNVTVYDGCRIGNRVIINANAVVGEDGFGYATHKGEHHKIPQVGSVVLEDDVEIGACCGIERGTLGDTVIGKGSKLGDLVAIGHGTRVGPYCLLVAQVGVAGSTTIGHHCVIGGQAGIVGHINVGNIVTIGAQAGVINSVPDGKVIVGAPAIDANKARRAYSLIEYLPEMKKTIRSLEKRIAELEKPEKP